MCTFLCTPFSFDALCSTFAVDGCLITPPSPKSPQWLILRRLSLLSCDDRGKFRVAGKPLPGGIIRDLSYGQAGVEGPSELVESFAVLAQLRQYQGRSQPGF